MQICNGINLHDVTSIDLKVKHFEDFRSITITIRSRDYAVDGEPGKDEEITLNIYSHPKLASNAEMPVTLEQFLKEEKLTITF